MVNEAMVLEPLATVTLLLAVTEPEVLTMPCEAEPRLPSMRPPMPKM